MSEHDESTGQIDRLALAYAKAYHLSAMSGKIFGKTQQERLAETEAARLAMCAAIKGVMMKDYVMVPVEPTEEMALVFWHRFGMHRDPFTRAYKAMLSAAPPRPQQQEIAELVEKIDGLYAKATKVEWRPLHTRIDGADGYQIMHGDLHGKTENENLANLRLVVALVNAWPQIKAALQTDSRERTHGT